MDEREYLTIDDAAAEMGRSVPTVWRLIKRYNLQTFRRPLDRRTYVRRADVEQLRQTFEPRVRGPDEGGKAAA